MEGNLEREGELKFLAFDLGWRLCVNYFSTIVSIVF